ncbi:hypothetical protein EHS25_005630 [Saitozyma podzolica]|uniref:Uncharacterized protein n=1 Tax=Saitozyma podzolica TaxID=1890683 RepID=A0A427XXW6_9TREE|nr:hypothetical protein EHS25_005630 [Saitozyma podzolica]
MVRTNEHETAVSAGAIYRGCFKGSDLRRTEIECVAWASQTLAGLGFAGQFVYFLQQAGVSASVPSSSRAKKRANDRQLGIPIGVLLNYQLNPTAWNWGGYTGFFRAESGLSVSIWAFFTLPERREGLSASWVSERGRECPTPRLSEAPRDRHPLRARCFGPEVRSTKIDASADDYATPGATGPEDALTITTGGQ